MVLVILVIPMKEKPVVVNLAVRVLRNVKQVNVFVRLLFVELNPMLTAVYLNKSAVPALNTLLLNAFMMHKHVAQMVELVT